MLVDSGHLEDEELVGDVDRGQAQLEVHVLDVRYDEAQEGRGVRQEAGLSLVARQFMAQFGLDLLDLAAPAALAGSIWQPTTALSTRLAKKTICLS